MKLINKFHINDKLQLALCWYEIIFGYLAQVAFIVAIADGNSNGGVGTAILFAIVMYALSTLCFLIGPLLVIVMKAFLQFLPALAPIMWLFFSIDTLFGSTNNPVYEYGYMNSFLVSIGMLAWAAFNKLAVESCIHLHKEGKVQVFGPHIFIIESFS